MRIALIAKLFAPVSSLSTGGTETFVYNLAKVLSCKGHQVTVFASGDSEIGGKVKVIPVTKISFWQKYVDNPKIFEQFSESRKAASEESIGYIKTLYYLKEHIDDFDLIHDNSLYFLPLILHQELVKLPLVATLHVPIDKFKTPEIIDDLNIKEKINNYYIAISENQKKQVTNLDIFDINYNGIDADRFGFCDKSENYLLWIGRIVPEKGLEKAIEVAIKVNMPLKIIGSIADESYFNDKIKNKIEQHENIEYLGEKSGQEIVELYQKAKIFLFPIDWEEPFGLVLTEAMACGTPVVAFNRGAVSEIIQDKVTGFICPPNDVGSMISSVERINKMTDSEYMAMRRACCNHVMENFTLQKMVEGYEKIYQRVIDDWKKKEENG